MRGGLTKREREIARVKNGRWSWRESPKSFKENREKRGLTGEGDRKNGLRNLGDLGIEG